MGQGLIEDCEFMEMGGKEGETSDLGCYVSRASVSGCQAVGRDWKVEGEGVCRAVRNLMKRGSRNGTREEAKGQADLLANSPS